MLPVAELVHDIPGRARFRIAGRRRDAAYFHNLQQRLSGREDVIGVETNLIAGSALVLHRTEASVIVQFAEEQELFTLKPAVSEATPFTQGIYDQGVLLSRRLRCVSRGQMDLGGLVFLALVTAGIFRVSRGVIWPAGFTLLWYAGNLLPKIVPRNGKEDGA